jgi:hypothetical protein
MEKAPHRSLFKHWLTDEEVSSPMDRYSNILIMISYPGISTWKNIGSGEGRSPPGRGNALEIPDYCGL